MNKTFNVGERVRFKDSAFNENLSPLFAVYKGHEFIVTGHIKDDDERPMKDHIFLRCVTGSIILGGAVCAGDLEAARPDTAITHK